MPHTHVGYDHDEGGTKHLSTEEKAMVDFVRKTWQDKNNKQRQFGLRSDVWVKTHCRESRSSRGACLLAISNEVAFLMSYERKEWCNEREKLEII